MKNKWIYGIVASVIVVGLIVALTKDKDSKNIQDLYEGLDDFLGCC